MISVEEREQIRRAYLIEGKTQRRIAKELRVSRKTVRKAIEEAGPSIYTLSGPRPAPVLDEYKARIEALLAEAERMPRKQRYTGRKIFELLKEEGFAGSESTVRAYIGRQRRGKQRTPVYLPLEFDPGEDAQVDWGEAVVEMGGERVAVQMFIMRLNYSRARFVMAFPFQKQEAFFEGHVQAFRFFGGVPKRITYDNLKTAVFRILAGRNREEQSAFVALRSHYLFESRYCTPGQGHEKGGVESDVGFAQRNFMTPMPRVGSYAELNALLHAACLRDRERRVRGSSETVAEKLAMEKSQMLELPQTDYRAYRQRLATVNPYGLVPLDTNRYSAPGHVGETVQLRAYAFHVEIWAGEEMIAQHERCFGQQQDVIEPLHYLTALVQRPGAFEHAIPMRRWRAKWAPIYETLLAALRQRWPGERGLQEFLSILELHREHAADQIILAIEMALTLGAVHRDGVQLCLRQLSAAPELPVALNLSQHTRLASIGEQPVNLQQYNALLGER